MTDRELLQSIHASVDSTREAIARMDATLATHIQADDDKFESINEGLRIQRQELADLKRLREEEQAMALAEFKAREKERKERRFKLAKDIFMVGISASLGGIITWILAL